MNDRLYRILLIEDDIALSDLITDFLGDFEFEVYPALSGASAIKSTLESSFDLVLCDVGLPDVNGFELLPRLQLHRHTPALFLTAVSDQKSQIRGLNAGACDYIVKPVDPELLLARVRANIRQYKHEPKNTTFQLHDLKLQREKKLAIFGDMKLSLTNQEFDALWLFATNAERVLTRDFFFKSLIGRPYDGKDRAADLRISRLRKKLIDLDLPGLKIQSVRNQGYVLRVAESSAFEQKET